MASAVDATKPDSILRIARWADIIAWVTLTIYVISWLSSMLLTLSQYYNGMFFEKGMGFLNAINYFVPYFQQVPQPWKPEDIVAKINDAVQKSMSDPSLRPKLEAQGVQFGSG